MAANNITLLAEFSSAEAKLSLEDLDQMILKLKDQSSDFNYEDNHVILRFLHCAFSEIKHFISNKTEITIMEQNQLEKILEFVVSLAILPNLIKGLNIISNKYSSIENNVCHLTQEQKFRIHSYAVDSLTNLITISIVLKSIIIKSHLGNLLASLYQLCYAPLQKPNTMNKKINFTMTETFYKEVTNGRTKHLNQLMHLTENVNKVQIFQQLLMLLYKNDKNIPPLFFRKIVYQELDNLLISDGGLKCLILSLITDIQYDPGKHWSNLNMIVNIIKNKHSQIMEETYFENILAQLLKLLHENVENFGSVQAIAGLACIKEFSKEKSLEKYASIIVGQISDPITNTSSKLVEQVLLENSLNILNFCFVQESQWKLDIKMLERIIPILYANYIIFNDAIKCKIEEIIYYYIKTLENEEFHNVLKIILEEKEFIVRITKIQTIYDSKCLNDITNVYTIINPLITLLESKKNQLLMYQLFVYILQNFCNKLTVLFIKKDLIELLLYLFEKEYIQRMLIKNPDCLVVFLGSTVDLKLKNGNNLEENNELINICLLLLSTIVQNCSNESLKKLIKVVDKFRPLNLSKEISLIIKEIDNAVSDKLKYDFSETQNTPYSSQSEFSIAMNEICDPLLPVRAHGILQLGRLIQENDIEAIAKKHYVLCILQENLKDEDSYIYLAVIKALTVVSKVCPKEVIELLTQEYLPNADNKIYNDGQVELRLKLGEALVKIISNADHRILHEYKSTFLNTFLHGTHDDDFLIRSSAYANLGELCKALGSSLSSEIILQIMNEVEYCIENEKSLEVKRASILLCTQLLIGLQANKDETDKKMGLLVLKPCLAPLLRSLKVSYENNSDEILKLHAQLAIEELDNIIKDFFKLTFNTS